MKITFTLKEKLRIASVFQHIGLVFMYVCDILMIFAIIYVCVDLFMLDDRDFGYWIVCVLLSLYALLHLPNRKKGFNKLREETNLRIIEKNKEKI